MYFKYLDRLVEKAPATSSCIVTGERNIKVI